jgi:RNA polymerase sigma-70 factor (ECF subfamily)
LDLDVAPAVANAFREEWGRVVATLIRGTGDWDLAEECAQDAFAQAWRRWPVEGVPRRPGAWLTTVARHRAIDRLRRRGVEAAKMEEVARMSIGPVPVDTDDDAPVATGWGTEGDSRGDPVDDRLRLIFTCCHPALPLEARVALTLRTLAGLTTSEIARAFLVPEATMAKRLVRAKAKIAHAGIPYRVPAPAALPARLDGVLAVLYLLFNEGYGASSGAELVRAELCQQAIRLSRALVGLLPDEPEAAGLLALLLLQDARRAARLDAAGDLVTLEEQDRSRWDHEQAAEGRAVLHRAMQARRFGPYQLQAAIAACHSEAGRAEDTDWVQIAGLYRHLADLTGSAVVELNRAVAVGMADGAAAGLRLLDQLDAEALGGYHLLPATRADLLRRLGLSAEAASEYRRALALVPTEPERRYLLRRLRQMTEADPAD